VNLLQKMNLPFTGEQFLEVFRKYNESVFPLQILFFLLALTAVYLVIRPSRNSGTVISAIVALLWLWTGSVYHIIFFSEINQAALAFGALFIMQSFFIIYYGVFRQDLVFRIHQDVNSFLGIILIIYALVVYPVIGYFMGHVYPSSPTFGLPCPTTIFTFGILLLNTKKWKFILFIIPLVWSVIGLSAAVQLNMREDFGLIISSLLVTLVFFYRKRKASGRVLT
jgi:hypothetical protein